MAVCSPGRTWSHRSVGGSRHKLGRVVFGPLQEISAAPQQEVVQGPLRVDVDVNEVSVRPHLQTHQQDSDIKRSVQLQRHDEFCFSFCWIFSCRQAKTQLFTWSMWFTTSKIRDLVLLPYWLHWRNRPDKHHQSHVAILKTYIIHTL